MATDLAPLAVGSVGTTAQRVTTRVPTGRAADSVSETVNRIRATRFDTVAAVAVVDEGRLLGVVAMERLLAAADTARLADVMDRKPCVVSRTSDQEQAARQAVQRNESFLAVVDESGMFCGLVAPNQLMAILAQEHDEDMARLGGFLHSVESARATSVERVSRRLWHRLPWLAVGLIGAMLSAGMMSAFESRLDAQLAVAYFVPGIVYLADAIGTQTETVAIRGLSVGVRIRAILVPEALTGLCVGVLLGLVMLPLTALMTGDWMLGAAVALSVLAAGAIATVVALALPWLLQALGKDPAFGSGPLATVIQDLLSIAIYLATVTVLVS